MSKIELNKFILREVDNNYEVLEFINKYFDIFSETICIISTSTKFNIEKLGPNEFSGIINLKKVNDARYINKFFEAVNKVLPNKGLYFGKVRTLPDRRTALLNKYPPLLNWFIYFIDTIFNRVLPKLWITKKLYFYLTKGKGRVISRAETFGRLYSCGFEIIDEKIINNHTYFIVRKIKKPVFDLNPSYGPLIKLKRVGKGGKLINVYKLRTMHPYSEYLQEYIYHKNNLREGGKIKNDFRITPEGRILRKLWVDEIPMLFNILKGDMKLIGVRPLSNHYYKLYDVDVQKARIENKPGLIPPFYADLPKTFQEIMESERKYLKRYKTSPVKTDLKYFLLALKNIFLRGARSA